MTIKDIAADTNLSLSTVSKFINNQKISKKNYKKIAESIQRLGYVPNQAARSLRSQNARTISILLPDIGDYFWGSFCSSFETALRAKGYSTMVSAYDKYDVIGLHNTQELQFLLSKQVAGVIFIPSFEATSPLLVALQEKGIPLICIDQIFSGMETDVITSFNRKGTQEATKYLIGCGHTNIHVLCGDTGAYTIRERIQGFRDALEEAHLPFSPEVIHGGTFSIQTGTELFDKIMQLDERPTAILSLGHDIAIGSLLAANKLNINFPENISFLTFDDDEIFTSIEPPITAVVQDLDEMGRLAAELIVKRVEGNYDGFPQFNLVDTHFLERKSVKKLIDRPVQLSEMRMEK